MPGYLQSPALGKLWCLTVSRCMLTGTFSVDRTQILFFPVELEPRSRPQALSCVPSGSEKVPLALCVCVCVCVWHWGAGRDLNPPSLSLPRVEAALPDLVPTIRD